MAVKLDQVSAEIGRLGGVLEQHLAAIERDRAAAEEERRQNAEYRKNVREQLAGLRGSVAEIVPLKKRVDRIEPIVDANARQIFVASSIIAGAFALIAAAIKMFGADLKAFVLRLFKVS